MSTEARTQEEPITIKRHRCYAGKNGWQECTACEGRIHAAGCTSPKDPKKDCCLARHEMLHAKGQTVGIHDPSRPMLWGGIANSVSHE